jgi:hypothetical protein
MHEGRGVVSAKRKRAANGPVPSEQLLLSRMIIGA